jgi:hypothetical protein
VQVGDLHWVLLLIVRTPISDHAHRIDVFFTDAVIANVTGSAVGRDLNSASVQG